MTAPLQFLLDGADVTNAHTTLLTIVSDLPIVGDDTAVPYAIGETFERRTPGAGDLQLGLLVEGSTVADWQLNWRLFKASVWKPHTTRVLTRRELQPDASVIESSAAATLVALPTATMQSDRSCLTTLELKLLDGYLYATTPVTITPPATVTIAGDVRTSRMTITMSAGTLTNTTTGAVLTYAGAGTAVIDVANWTATAGGSPVDGDVSWPVAGHDFWFDLDPGANVLTGTASIDYSPAYLP